MRKIFLTVAIILSYCFSANAGVDPATSAAVIAENTSLKSAYEKRIDEQKKIKGLETTIAASMAAIHNVENTMLDYLTNISDAVRNLHQIVDAAELVIAIPRNAELLMTAIREHPRNAILAPIVSTQITRLCAEATTLYPFMQQLVTTGTYNSGDDRRKVNLLNSAERYMIASMVVSKLSNINRALTMLRWQIQFFTWNEFFRGIDCQSWATYWGARATAEKVIYDWQRFRIRTGY